MKTQQNQGHNHQACLMDLLTENHFESDLQQPAKTQDLESTVHRSIAIKIIYVVSGAER